MKNETLRHALALILFGFSVIPIDCRTKKPLIEWQKYQEQPASKEEIKKWFENNPDAGIAIITGKVSGLCVIDVDPRNGGENSLFVGYDTVSVKTGGGGFHYYFAYPKEGINSHPKFIKGVDFKSDGGYIICPPSKHPSGGIYEWIKSPSKAKIIDLPEGIKEAIQRNNFTSEFDPLLLEGVPEGRRNESAAKVIGKILHGLKPDDWQTIGWQIVRGWNDKNIPPMDEKELFSVFKSIAQRESQSRATLYTKGSDMAGVIPKVEAKLITDLKIGEGNDVSWVWEGFLARGHITLLSALWKSGKTVFLTYFLKKLQEGEDFCSRKTAPCKVLIISEESEIIWARRREEYDLNYPIWILSRPIRARLSYREWVKFLEDISEFCSKEKIDLVVVDTLSAFWSVTNESDASEMQAALLPLNNLLQKGLACFLIHHHRKGGGTEGTAARGSGALGSHVDIMVDFERMAGDPETTQRKLTAYSRFEETPRQIVVDFVDGAYITLGSPAEVNKQQKFNFVLSILKENQNGMTVQDILQNWDSEENGKKPSKRTLQRYLSEMAETNQVINVGTKEISGGLALIYRPASSDFTLTPVIPTTTQVQNPRQARPKSIGADTGIENMTKSEIKQIFSEG